MSLNDCTLGPYDGNPLKAWHGLWMWLTEELASANESIRVQGLELEAEWKKVAKLTEERDEARDLRNSQIRASDACGRKDGEKALVALAAAQYATPQEGYGTNTSWSISDLCRAVADLRARLQDAENLAAEQQISPRQKAGRT